MTERRVGIEIEFAGPSLKQAVAALVDQCGARARQRNDCEYELYLEPHDQPFRLEVDLELLKKLGQQEAESPNVLREAAIGLLESAATLIVPLELITPPLPFDQVASLEAALSALVSVGSVGTQDSWAYAFGTHFNPDVTDTQPDTILAHLRAFLCLYEWLKARDRMDMTRKLVPFTKPFPKKYERLVLAWDYAPDQNTLIDDYLAHSPTRNRALDLLPLFAHLDAARVRAGVDDPRIKARPTYHYRLPNSRLGDPAWSLSGPWQGWLTVERLARDHKALSSLCEERLEALENRGLFDSTNQWVDRCQRMVESLESA